MTFEQALAEFKKDKLDSEMKKDPNITWEKSLRLFWEWIKENGYLITELY